MKQPLRVAYGVVVCLAVVSQWDVRPARAQIEILDAPGAWDLLFDEGRGLLYISTEEGEILRYDVAAGAFRTPLHVVDRPLTDLTLSADGSFLVAVEPPPAGPLAAGWSGLHWIDLGTGVATPIEEPTSWPGLPAYDAEFLPDGTVLVTSVPRPADPGAAAWVRRYDRASGRFTSIQTIEGPAQIAVSRNRARVLVSSAIGHGTALYDGALAPIWSRWGGGWSPVFLQDEFGYATAVDQSTGLSAPIYAYRIPEGYHWFWTVLQARDTFTRPGPPVPVALAFAPKSERLYSTWRADAGAVVLVHRLADAPGPEDVRWLGVLDASFVYPMDPADDRASGRIEILPDESKMFVAAPDGVRVYDPTDYIDPDGDGIVLDYDNCPSHYNPDQENTDRRALGDACNDIVDPDGDEYEIDNCPNVYNPDQANRDGGPFGDVCNDHEDADGDDFADYADNCPDVANDQADLDGDRIGDACDPFPTEADHVLGQLKLERDQALAEAARLSEELALCLAPPDADGDGVADADDRCPGTAPGAVVDGDGCGRAQFCAAVEVRNLWDGILCIRADWRGDDGWIRRDCRPAWRRGSLQCVATH